MNYDLAFEEWSEKGAAQDQYDSDLSDGLIPAERYTIDGVGVNHQPFEEWLDSPAGDLAFERWFEDETDPANRYDTDPRV